MKYKILLALKEFKDWDCNHFPDEERCSHDFYEKYENPFNTKKPTKNPFEDAIFDVGDTLYDIYTLRYVLHAKHGFIISNKFYDVLNDCKLGDHVVFDDIKYIKDGEKYNDMKFIFFYRDYSLNIDWDKSRFCLTEKKKLKNYEDIPPDIIIDDNFKVTSYEDYKQKLLYYSKQKDLKVRPINIVCPSAKEYDMFSFFNNYLTSQVFISTKLIHKLEEYGIKGLDFKDFRYSING